MGRPDRWLAGLLGLSLAALALPRLGSAVLLLEGGPVLERLQTGQETAPAALTRMAAGARSALHLTDSPEAWRRLDAAGIGGLVRVVPTDPYAWAREAHRRLDAGDVSGARRAVRRSLELGPWERSLIVDRLPVLARVADSPDDHTRLHSQLRRAWEWHRPRLLRLLPVADAWPLYRRALADDPAALAEAAVLSGLFAKRVGRD